MSSRQYPLREKRKQQNRADLLNAAFELFADKGYADTSLEEVASRAGLHVQTLFRHFPTKSDLVAEIWHQSLDQFEEFFSVREVDALSAWRSWVEQNARQATQAGNAQYQKRLASFWEFSFVSITTLKYWHGYQEVLAAGIAEDMGVDIDEDPLPMLIACMLWGGNESAARKWAKTGKGDLSDVLLKVVDTVIDQYQDKLNR